MPSERIQRRIDALLDEADQAFTARDWPRLRELCDSVLRLDPDNEDAKQFLEATGRDTGVVQLPGPAASGIGSGDPPRPEPLPASFVSGRYRVLRLLGQGGRKRVYLARDERLGREVAFAVVPGDALTAADRERVQREARAMARLGANPHLVSIHDIGEDGNDLFTVQEYMAGGDIAGLIARSEEKRVPIEETVAIARDVSRALSAIHAAGIVHRDLKPANVFLASDGSARLGDFGLAADTGMDRLTQHGTMLGTVAYMPPEQAIGGEVTAQADLYSLGAMLYEMVTGRPPFAGDDPTAVITQHLSTSPIAPSYLAERCPASLEKLILQLLEKDPGKRPESASAVLVALEAMNPEEASVRHSQDRPLERLARGIFVGREKELERLRKAFDEAFAGRGGVVMVVGEPGIGKTRTTQELETYARMRGAAVLWGRTHESGGAPPYWPWLQAGNQWLPDREGDLELPTEILSELSRLFTSLRRRPNFVEPGPETSPEDARFRLFDAFATLLRTIADEAPLVVALDDLHWADRPTLLLLQHVGRELSRSRILVVGNYRDTDITRQSALSETLAALNRESSFERIVLRGLSRDEVAAYIHGKANVEPKREVLDRIFEETEGNPFFLSEVVNLMAEEGTLAKDSVSDIAIPDGVREALGRRLNRLSRETNDLLQVASIVGREFEYEALAAIDGRDEDALVRRIEEALDAHVIEEMERPGRYRFAHAQMQETLLAELSTTRRVRLHGRVGEVLEELWGQRAEQHAAQLARHFVEATTLAPRFVEKAVRLSTMAGRHAVQRAAFAEAERHFEAALSVLEGRETDEVQAAILLELGGAQRATLDIEDGWRSLSAAFDFYASRGDVEGIAGVCRRLGSEFSSLKEHRLPLELLQRAVGLVTGSGRAEFDALVALAAWPGLREEVATSALERAERLLEMEPDPEAELALLRARGWVQWNAGDPATASTFERLAKLAASRGRAMEAAGAWDSIAHDAYYRGRIEAASDAFVAARRYAEQSGFRRRIASVANGQAGVAFIQGRWDEARKHIARGLDAAPADGVLRWTRAYIELESGDYEGVRTTVAELDGLCVAGRPFLVEASYGIVAAMAAQYGVSDRHLERAAAVATSVQWETGSLLGGIAATSLALLAVARHDSGLAAAALEGLGPHAGRFGGSYYFHTSHLLGLLALEFGEPGEAIAHLEAARTFLARGYVVPCARTSVDAAQAYLARRDEGDEDRARLLLDEAAETARGIGMKPLLERIVALKVRLQGITGDVRTSIVAVNDAVQSEHPDVSLDAARDGTVTLMFTDIENSTALNEQMGDAEWLKVLRAHNAVVEKHTKAHGGRVVKNRGDGYMLTFARPDRGLACALAIQQALARHEVIRVRIGLHTGNPQRDGEDFFGTDVNLAARIADRARGGQVLVSKRTHGLLARRDDGDTRFGEPVEVELKGLTGRHRVFEVGRT